MKRIISIITILVLCCVMCMGLTACNKNKPVKLIAVDLSSEEYAFAVKKDDDALLSSVNEFLAEEKDAIDAVFAKYMAEDAPLTTFGRSDIQTTPTGSDDELVVATNLDFMPFEYTNGNKIAGIDMEIAQLLADYLGKTLVIVHMEFDAVVTSVQLLDDYDIGMAGLTITPDRAELINFSDAYFGATQSIIVMEDDTTFDGMTTAAEVEAKLATLTGDAAKCGGQKGTTSYFYITGSEDFGFAGFENLTFSSLNNAALAIQEMANGKIAFVVVDKTTATALVNNWND